MGGEIVARARDRLAGAQPAHMLDQQRHLDGVRMIEVQFIALGRRESGLVLVIIVLLQQRYAGGGEGFDNPARERRLAGARPAADANDYRSRFRLFASHPGPSCVAPKALSRLSLLALALSILDHGLRR